MVLISLLKWFSFSRRFARKLGFSSYQAMRKATFRIFRIPPDADCYATRLPDGKWAVWDDKGSPPYKAKVFADWEQAAAYLRELFEKRGCAEEC